MNRLTKEQEDKIRGYADSRVQSAPAHIFRMLLEELDAVRAERDSARSLVKDICAEWDEKCEPECSSWGHEEECRAVHISAAKRALNKQKLALAASEMALREALTSYALETKTITLITGQVITLREIPESCPCVACEALSRSPSELAQAVEECVEALKYAHGPEGPPRADKALARFNEAMGVEK